LRALCTLSDGAAVARADLALRGAGDLSGTRQHGLEAGEPLLFLDPAAPPSWLARLEADARALLREDPTLAQESGLALAVRRLRRAIAVREEAG
jgi:ATP-dependent DNA helicase RecG